MFEIIFDEEAIDFLNKLDKKLKARIFNKIMMTKENPFHYFERLSGHENYKLRIGDYRIIADIDTKESKIKITLIGHRKNIYRNF